MSSPTSPSSCDNCLQLSQKVSVLEERISVLYHLRDEELLLDSLVSACPAVATSAPAADSTDSEVFVGPHSPTSATGEMDSTLPLETAADDRWAAAGAKSKAPPSDCSNAVQSMTWHTVGGGNHTSHRRPRSYPPPVPQPTTSNKYSLLDMQDFPPLHDHTVPPVSLEADERPNTPPPPAVSTHRSQRHAPSSRPGVTNFTPHPHPHPHSSSSSVIAGAISPPDRCPDQATSARDQRQRAPSSSSSARRKMLLSAVMGHRSGRPAQLRTTNPPPLVTIPSPPNLPPVQIAESSPPPLFPPTALIIGDSITRDIKYVNAITLCYPGATVPIITDKLLTVLPTLPPSITRIVVHVGTNDTSQRESVCTEINFKLLFNVLQSSGKFIFISGPIPCLGRGTERFSRLLQQHTWLKTQCSSHNFLYIDNFNLFWDRRSLFSSDGVHPNTWGSHMLLCNIQHAGSSVPVNP